MAHGGLVERARSASAFVDKADAPCNGSADIFKRLSDGCLPNVQLGGVTVSGVSPA